MLLVLQKKGDEVLWTILGVLTTLVKGRFRTVFKFSIPWLKGMSPSFFLYGTIANDQQSIGNNIDKANLSMQSNVFEPSLSEDNDQTGFRQPPPAVAQI